MNAMHAAHACTARRKRCPSRIGDLIIDIESR